MSVCIITSNQISLSGSKLKTQTLSLKDQVARPLAAFMRTACTKTITLDTALT